MTRRQLSGRVLLGPVAIFLEWLGARRGGGSGITTGALPDRVAKDPAALVERFIEEYSRWNAAAMQRHSFSSIHLTPEEKANLDLSVKEHHDLVARYCRPGFSPRQCSWGVPSLHAPGSEVIAAVEQQGDSCLVRTRTTDGRPLRGFEYRMSRADGRWFLESIRGMVGDNSYENL
ncbi:hypothetical protein OJF2_41070 [Aquisphaera giovannonii]|uniref:NTF2 fold immunity protein domain-containing protein n=1 Tax=Aquisphaera giovannonii TaxID=406548 RepID=A0A5B9W5S5_9BACT|nr:hypothetical protein [Aquisphaera giovannonii]QEH35554.1 hypothetical protein OJF2_41070 [Aquisphaera giovannonii]